MTIKRLTDMIRFEARLAGSSTATAFIIELILEILREYTAIEMYQELLITNAILPIAVAGDDFVSLSGDFQHLRAESVRYRPNNDPTQEYRLLESEYFQGQNVGPARKFQLQGGTISFFPFSESLTTDRIVFDQYQFVSDVIGSVHFINDASPFPIPSLEGPVKKAVVARLLRTFGKDDSREDADAERGLVRSKGDGTTS